PFIADNAPPVVAVKGISEFGPDPDNRICSRKVVGQKARIVAVCQIKSELKNRFLVSSDIKNSGIVRSLHPRDKITGAGIPRGIIKACQRVIAIGQHLVDRDNRLLVVLLPSVYMCFYGVDGRSGEYCPLRTGSGYQASTFGQILVYLRIQLAERSPAIIRQI